MRVKLIALILIAGAASFAAVTLTRGWLADRRAELEALRNSQPVAVQTIDTVEVLVAEEDLPSGSFLSLDQFHWTPFPSEGLPKSYVTRLSLTETAEDPKAEDPLAGAVIRGPLAAGDPLTQGRIIRPGDRGFLAAVLRPDMRAVSVPIDATTGISGFVFPGDRVDLLLTHEIELAPRTKRLATETVLHDVRVLAMDQRTNDTEGEPTLAKTATLEVSSKEAEVIAVALRMGRLSLALRSLAQLPDALAAATPLTAEQTYTWDSQASMLIPPIARAAPAPVSGPAAKAPPPKTKVTVIRGGATETVEFTGAEQLGAEQSEAGQ